MENHDHQRFHQRLRTGRSFRATSRAAGILAIVGDSDAAIAAEQAAGYFRDQLIDALEATVAK